MIALYQRDGVVEALRIPEIGHDEMGVRTYLRAKDGVSVYVFDCEIIAIATEQLIDLDEGDTL